MRCGKEREGEESGVEWAAGVDRCVKGCSVSKRIGTNVSTIMPCYAMPAFPLLSPACQGHYIP